MIKLNKKAIVALVLAVITIMLCVAPVFAADEAKAPLDFVSPTPPSDTDTVVSAGNKVLGYIQVIGTLIAVGVLMFLGIRYMTASANDKADIQKSMIPYIVGAVILLLAVNIMPLIQTLSDTLFGTVAQ